MIIKDALPRRRTQGRARGFDRCNGEPPLISGRHAAPSPGCGTGSDASHLALAPLCPCIYTADIGTRFHRSEVHSPGGVEQRRAESNDDGDDDSEAD